MKRSIRHLFFGLISGFCIYNLYADDVLFRYEGKDFTIQSLPAAAKQQFYEVDKQRFDTINRVIEGVVLKEYIADQAKAKKKSPADIEQQMFATKIGEKEAKKWFEENKERLGGRSFDSIKTEIVGFLQGQAREQMAKDMIEKLKKDKKLIVSQVAPVAPVIDINVSDSPRKGSEKAKVKIVEFADYRCPHCKHAADVLKAVTDKMKDKVDFYFLDYPLQLGGVSTQIAEGGVCAKAQNKFWEYHYLAFDKQQSLGAESAQEFAKELKLDVDAFTKCLSLASTKDKVMSARKEGERIGVEATPSVYINGVRYSQNLDEATVTAYLKPLL